MSAAQTALFESPHLGNIGKPTSLEYRYHYDAAPDRSFDDRIDLKIQEIHDDGTKYVAVGYLTGEHHFIFPAVDNFRGNPLLMAFLEHDVTMMKQQTGVPAAYLRNRVRQGFVDQAVLNPTTIDLGHGPQPATEIKMKPFATDPRFAKLPSVAGKTYIFVLSDAVAGTIYHLRTEMPAAPESDGPAISEDVIFSGEVK